MLNYLKQLIWNNFHVYKTANPLLKIRKSKNQIKTKLKE